MKSSNSQFYLAKKSTKNAKLYSDNVLIVGTLYRYVGTYGHTYIFYLLLSGRARYKLLSMKRWDYFVTQPFLQHLTLWCIPIDWLD